MWVCPLWGLACTRGGRPVTHDVVRAAVQLVPAVTELIIAELLYLQYKDRTKPIFLYINSTGTTRADGETVLLLPPLACSLPVLPRARNAATLCALHMRATCGRPAMYPFLAHAALSCQTLACILSLLGSQKCVEIWILQHVQGAQQVFGAVQVGFETEGTAIYDTMQFVKNEVSAPRLAASNIVTCPSADEVLLRAS